LKLNTIITGLCISASAICHAEYKSQLISNLEAGKKQLVVAYGSSLTAGGIWVNQLSDELNKQYPNLATVINSGGAGQWSKWGVTNLKPLVIDKKPDTVFIEFAINDSVERFHGSVEIAKKNLETIIDGILNNNPKCEIILMTMTPGDKYPKGHQSYRKDIDKYYEMYRTVAQERGFLLIDHYPNWKLLQKHDIKTFTKYVPDTIHPTAEGCEVVVTPVIFKSIGLTAQQEADVQQISTGYKFTEGPALAPNGDIYFTDIPNNKIHIWSTNQQASTYRENTSGANGLMFDKKGNLIACKVINCRVTSISSDGEVKILADTFDGKKLNGPNDLWITPNGGIYFTDPIYGKKENVEQDGEHVYYISTDNKPLKRVINDMVRPNGIIGTPDGKTLYVADHGDNKTFKYAVEANGDLSNKQLFIEQGSDGMTLDADGNLYITTDAVYVYSPKGTLIQKIEVPETPSNVCFSKDGKTLFITARTSLYATMIEND
jgi:gluconolactonase